jgi:tellurite resistance protein TerC
MIAATVGTPLLWLAFVGLVLALLALDLGVFHRKAHAIGTREALVWTAVWVGLTLVFNVAVYFRFGRDTALDFLTGYIIEKSLSVDNIFVFVVLFGHFKVPAALQHRVLFWGILGAIVMRGAFILAGVALLERFHWMMYLFGALLVATGIKLLFRRTEAPDPAHNPIFRMFQRIVPATDRYHGTHFVVREAGRWVATPLLLVLFAIESSDVVFAIDSIPAIFAITTDPFIVFTSNIFALLGLRSLYFALAGVMDRFRELKVGLALILVFVGAKMLLADVYKVPVLISLAVIVGVLVVTSLVAVQRERVERRKGTPARTDIGRASDAPRAGRNAPT